MFLSNTNVPFKNVKSFILKCQIHQKNYIIIIIYIGTICDRLGRYKSVCQYLVKILICQAC